MYSNIPVVRQNTQGVFIAKTKPSTIQANINFGMKLQLETHFRKLTLHALYISKSSKLINKGRLFFKSSMWGGGCAFSILKVS